MQILIAYMTVQTFMIQSALADAPGVIDKATEFMTTPVMVTAASIGGVILDIILRKKKTKKPASVIRMISKTVLSVAGLLEGIAKWVDKIVPDNTK